MNDPAYEAMVNAEFFNEDYPQYLDSKAQTDNNRRLLTANGPCDYIEIKAEEQFSHAAKLQANDFSFCFDYHDVDSPDGDHMHVWTRPSTGNYREMDIESLVEPVEA
jgi:hypothetical protein